MVDNIQGNLSTVLVAVYAILAPYISQYISQDVFLAIIGLILVIWSAYHPNTFEIFGNKINKPVDNGILNDEYTTGDSDE